MELGARIRRYGVAAIAGGVMGILLTPVITFAGWMAGPASDPPPMLWARMLQPVVMPLIELGTAERAIYLYGKMFFPVYVLFLLGLLGLHLLLSGRAGRSSEWGFRLALVGLTLNLLGNIGDYWLGAFESLELVKGIGYMIGTLLGTLIYTVGSVLLGWTILRRNLLPGWVGWVLVLTPLLGISMLFWGVHYTPANFLLGNSLCWLLLGWMLTSQGVGLSTRSASSTERETR